MTPALQQMLEHCKTQGLDKHPYLIRLAAKPAELSRVHEIMANARGFAGNFCNWIAAIIVRTEDPRLQSLLARQLNDELGNGDPTKIHLDMYDVMVASLAPWKKAQLSLQPGEGFREAAGRAFTAPNVYEALGAVMAGEIFAAQFDAWFAGELSRQLELDLKTVAWYSAHETVEVEHANDSTRMAELIPPDEVHQAAALRGAKNFERAIVGFLDAISRQASSPTA